MSEQNPGDTEEREEALPVEEVVVASYQRPLKKIRNNQHPVPLWLVTFTDVMALMLTFFVLLYAMSETPEESWIKVTQGLSSKLEQFDASAFNAGSQDVIQIDKISESKALNLDYVKTLIAKLLNERGIEGVDLIENDKRLVVSVPSELLFQSGSATMEIEGKKLLFTLGGVLEKIKNEVEIVGHTDPDLIKGQGMYRTNWDLSLARAASVAGVLKEVGYSHALTIRGLSSGRFDELPDTLDIRRKYALSRRVDIIIMQHDGYRYNAFKP